MNSEEYRNAATQAIDDIAKYHESVDSRQVVADVEPGYLRPLLPDRAPVDPEPMSDIQADVASKIMPGITNWSSPRFMAFFPASTSFPGEIAEMYSTAFTGAHFNWICSPAVTELETIVLDWVAHALALPECFLSTGSTAGGGVIHGSASEAVLTVMIAARDKFLAGAVKDLPEADREEASWEIRSKMVALGSAGSHSSTKKAAQLLGVRYATVPVSAENGYSMTGEAVTQKVAALKAKGLKPFYLTATMGTTDVCAVDDFEGIAKALSPCDDPSSIWVHVDAAYAGTALILPEHQDLAKHFSAFQSFNFNAHKWMLTPFDCSLLWIRSRALLIESMSIKPPYLRNQFSEGGLVTDYRDWQIPLGRRFRSLKLWFVLRSHGLRGLQEHVSKGIGLAEELEKKLAGRSDLFTIFTPAKFALLTFRVKAPSDSEEEGDTLTEELYDTINKQGDFYLTSTVVNGRFAIRVCTGVAKCQEKHVSELFDLAVAHTEGFLKN